MAKDKGEKAPDAPAADPRKIYRKYKAFVHSTNSAGVVEPTARRPVLNGNDYLFDTHDDALKAGIDELVKLGYVVVEPVQVRRKVDVTYEEVAP